MKIAGNLITKGDEELNSIKKCITSMLPAVDTVHIVTNGKQYKKTHKWAKDNGFDIQHIPWDDNFSEQRNANKDMVPEDTDYILWADSDDVILNASIIRNVARIAKQNNHDAVFFTYWYGVKFDGNPSIENMADIELKQMRERLLKPESFKWKKRIHETPVPLDGDTYSYTKVDYSKEYPVAWLHLGAHRDQSPKTQKARTDRNKRLLEKELEDERMEGEADPRTILYLMKVLAEENDRTSLKRLINLGTEYMTKSGWDEERAVCQRLMSKALGKLKEHEASRDMLFSAIREYPHDPLNYLYLARVYYNLKNYRAMKHFMDIAMKMDLDDNNTAMNNILEMKVLVAELNTKYYLDGEKDVEKAYKAARLLNRLDPKPEHEQNVEYLFNQAELNKASRNTHKLIKYFEDIGRYELIPELIENLPDEMKVLPFANRYYNRYKQPKVWGEDEICYFANFGQPHFEKWSPRSLDSGVGGSETAVIRLSEQWAKQGYKVTVYGDPGIDEGEYNGVKYLPFYKFNQRDKFNIFIAWRHNMMTDKVSAKKMYVDLHDVWSSGSYMKKLSTIDKIFVKSDYHKELGHPIPDSKFKVISNGI